MNRNLIPAAARQSGRLVSRAAALALAGLLAGCYVAPAPPPADVYAPPAYYYSGPYYYQPYYWHGREWHDHDWHGRDWHGRDWR